MKGGVVRDEELAAGLADDLDGHVERLVLCYQNRLYAFALRLTGSAQDAEEIAQDAFVQAYRALARYPREQVRTLALRPWLYRIALNVTRNRVRGGRVRIEPLAEEGYAEPAADEAERPETWLERVERRDNLAALVAALPERYRVAVVLRHVSGLGYREMAQALGQPEGTIKSNVHRGLALLRKALERRAEPVGGRR
jgi:RNA polymerase sigma-70 factor (ECF subfamily)